MSTKILVYDLPKERAQEVEDYIRVESDETVAWYWETPGSVAAYYLLDPYDYEAVWALADRLAEDFGVLVCVEEDDESFKYFGAGSERLNFRLAVNNAILALDELAEFKNVEFVLPVIEQLEKLDR